MDEPVKQRLIGAAVLVALAVIFLPVLLEDPGDDLGPVGTNLPAPPQTEFRRDMQKLELPAPPPVAPPIADTAGETGADAVTESDTVAESEAAVPTAPMETPAVAAETPAASTPVAEAAAPPPAAEVPAPPSAPAEEPAPALPAGATSGWVIQLGSFSNRDNAYRLRDELRTKKFTAFVEEVATAGGKTWRVRIGPEIQRENADRLRDRLAAEQKIEGKVYSYP